MKSDAAVNDLHEIGTALKRAQQYGLESEVIWSALQAMRCNTDITISEAMNYGLGEWDL